MKINYWKCKVRLLGILILLLFFVGVAYSVEYEFIKNEFESHGRIRAGLSQCVMIVNSKISEKNVRSVLEKLKRAAQLKRRSSSNYFVLAEIVTDKQNCGKAIRIGFLQKLGTNPNYEITIYPMVINGINEKPKVIFGLNKKQRKEIWNISIIRERADNRNFECKLLKKSCYNPNHLQEKAWFKKNYSKLTEAQIDEISIEGVEKGWSFPPRN